MSSQQGDSMSPERERVGCICGHLRAFAGAASLGLKPSLRAGDAESKAADHGAGEAAPASVLTCLLRLCPPVSRRAAD